MSSLHTNKKFPQRPLPSRSPSPDFGFSRVISPTTTPHIRRYSNQSMKTVQLVMNKTNQKTHRLNHQLDKLGNPKSRRHNSRLIGGEGHYSNNTNNLSTDLPSATFESNTNETILFAQNIKTNHHEGLDTSRRVRSKFDCSQSPRRDFNYLKQQSQPQSPEDFSPPIGKNIKSYKPARQLQEQLQEATTTIDRLRSVLQTNETHLRGKDKIQVQKSGHQNKRGQLNQKLGFIQNKSRSALKSHYQNQIKYLEATIQKMTEGAKLKHQSRLQISPSGKDKDMEILQDRISSLEQELQAQKISKNRSQQALQLAHNNLDASQNILQVVTDQNQKLKATLANIKLQCKQTSRPGYKVKQQQGTLIQHLTRNQMQARVVPERSRILSSTEAYPCAQQIESAQSHIQSIDVQKLDYYTDRHKFIECTRVLQQDNYKLTRKVQTLQFEIQKLTVVCERHQDDNKVLVKQIKHLETAIQSYLKNHSKGSAGNRRIQGLDAKHHSSLNLEDGEVKVFKGTYYQPVRVHAQAPSSQTQAGPGLALVFDTSV